MRHVLLMLLNMLLRIVITGDGLSAMRSQLARGDRCYRARARGGNSHDGQSLHQLAAGQLPARTSSTISGMVCSSFERTFASSIILPPESSSIPNILTRVCWLVAATIRPQALAFYSRCAARGGTVLLSHISMEMTCNFS